MTHTSLTHDAISSDRVEGAHRFNGAGEELGSIEHLMLARSRAESVMQVIDGGFPRACEPNRHQSQDGHLANLDEATLDSALSDMPSTTCRTMRVSAIGTACPESANLSRLPQTLLGHKHALTNSPALLSGCRGLGLPASTWACACRAPDVDEAAPRFLDPQGGQLGKTPSMLMRIFSIRLHGVFPGGCSSSNSGRRPCARSTALLKLSST